MLIALVEKNSRIAILVGDSTIRTLSTILSVLDIVEINSIGTTTIPTDLGNISTISLCPKGKIMSKDYYHLVTSFPDTMSLKDVHTIINDNY